MRIKDIFKEKTVFSFEVFPPKKTSPIDVIYTTLEELRDLSPDFISVTFSAGGSGNGGYAIDVASKVKEYGITPMIHLPCINYTKDEIKATLTAIQENGIENILALRGDINPDIPPKTDFAHASGLISYIKSMGDFDIGGACYPEGHVECAHKDEDIRHLKEKVDAGCDFLTTQMFFDNSIYYNFLYRIREAGITVPVLAGIMPITNPKQVGNAVKLSGTIMPARFISMVDRFGDNPEAMKQAGVIYACEQILDLISNDCTHIHVYTMNKPDVAKMILDSLSYILGRETAGV